MDVVWRVADELCEIADPDGKLSWPLSDRLGVWTPWANDMDQCLRDVEAYDDYLKEEIIAAVRDNDIPRSYIREMCNERSQMTLLWKEFIYDNTHDPWEGVDMG